MRHCTILALLACAAAGCASSERGPLQAAHRRALADSIVTLFDSLAAIHRARPDTALLLTQRFSQRRVHLLDHEHALLTATEAVEWADTAGVHQYAGLLTLAVSRRGSRWVIRAYRGS